MEERVVDSQSAYPSTSSNLSKRVEMEMSDSNWMAKEQLMKPVLLSQVPWSTSQTVDTAIYRVRFPQVLETVDSLALRTLRMYAFYKLSPCFRIQINATQFHQGQLICSFDPFSMLSSYTSDNPNNPQLMSHYTATGLPSVKIMASESDAVELCIPFIHLRSFLTTNNTTLFNNMGTFDIRVLNSLLAAAGASSTLTVSIWVYARDAQVHVPIYDHDPILEPTSKNLQSKQLVKLSSNNSIFDSVKQGISQTTDIIGNVLTGNFGQALRKGQGLIDTVGSIFGFDYPSNTISPDKNITPYENLAVAIGKSRSQRMAIDPFSMHILEDDVASESMTAMDLLTIARTPMLLTQFTVSDTENSGTPLLDIPITPAYQVTQIFDRTYQPTYLSHVSSAFTYWSGGIVYDFEVVATRFHSAKLLIAYVPNLQITDRVTYEQALSSCPNALLDIQQTSKLSIIIPFTSTTPVKSTAFSTDIDSVINGSSYAETCNGRLLVFLVNTLAHASNVAPSIDLNLYISAADDFKLFVPRKPEFLEPGPISPTLEATSGIGITHEKNNIDEPTQAVLSKGQSRSVISSRYGENYTLRDVIKRFSKSISLVGESQIIDTLFSFRVTPFVPSATGEIYDNYLSYWSGIYSAWSGSIRYKIYIPSNRTTTGEVSVTHFQDQSDATSISLSDYGYATIATTAPQDNVMEIEAPYYSKYNMLLTRTRLSVDQLNLVNGSLLVRQTSDLKPEEFVIYLAAGEDFRFIYLRPPLSSSSQFQSHFS